jgi:hypothetical protein
MTPAHLNCTLKFPVRLSAPELAQVRAKAAHLGLTVADYMRTCMGYGYPAQEVPHPLTNRIR